MSAPTLQDAEAVLAAQRFSALLGTTVREFGADAVELELDITADLLQQHGLVHGGVLAYLVDNAVTFAAGAALGRDIVTSGIAVEYLTSVSAGTLRARAWLVARGASFASVRCDVSAIGPDGTVELCAVGQGRAVPRRHSHAGATNNSAEEGTG